MYHENSHEKQRWELRELRTLQQGAKDTTRRAWRQRGDIKRAKLKKLQAEEATFMNPSKTSSTFSHRSTTACWDTQADGIHFRAVEVRKDKAKPTFGRLYEFWHSKTEG